MFKVSATLLLVTLISCTFREDKRQAVDESQLKPWYTNLYSNIFARKCLECHNGPGCRGKVDLSTYESILTVVVKGFPEYSPLYSSLQGVGGNMPLDRPSLSSGEIQSIYDWIKNQAPMDGSEPPPPPPPPDSGTQPTYAWINDYIFKPKCVGCHSGPGADGGVDLSAYDKFANDLSIVIKGDPDNSVLYDVLLTDRMPRPVSKDKPPNLLNPTEKKAVYDWIKNGAKEKEEQ